VKHITGNGKPETGNVIRKGINHKWFAVRDRGFIKKYRRRKDDERYDDL
jgi:hypothetical protein